MDDPVPVMRDIADLYPQDALEAQRKRFDDLKAQFAYLYGGKAPDFIARSPGRVNLIGEHIDCSSRSFSRTTRSKLRQGESPHRQSES